ncbi:Uncharacterized protein Rs2_49533 [Raphanus sativus]|nr:Uncharacterized protein Rs2_49533 [Raphanus sativus]
MATATSQGRDPLFVSSSFSSSKSDRAAAIRIRFADIIVKSSSNKSEAMLKIKREEKARMKLRQEARLAVLKVEEEEARSDCKYENPLSVEKELLSLIGGSRRARDRSLLKQFGLVLKPDVDDDVLDDLEEDLRDDKLFLIDHHVAVHVTSAQEYIYVLIQANVDTGRQVRAAVKKRRLRCGSISTVLCEIYHCDESDIPKDDVAVMFPRVFQSSSPYWVSFTRFGVHETLPWHVRVVKEAERWVTTTLVTIAVNLFLLHLSLHAVFHHYEKVLLNWLS